jgi:hypothetical protein
MEFNVYIKIFDKIKEFDVKPSYSIVQVKQFIVKFLKISFEFELYYNNQNISYGTIMSNNITEDTIIILAPVMKTGKSLDPIKNSIKYDSLESVKFYLKTNYTSSDSNENKDEEENEGKSKKLLSEEDIEINKTTMDKLQMLRLKYLKKN